MRRDDRILDHGERYIAMLKYPPFARWLMQTPCLAFVVCVLVLGFHLPVYAEGQDTSDDAQRVPASVTYERSPAVSNRWHLSLEGQITSDGGPENGPSFPFARPAAASRQRVVAVDGHSPLFLEDRVRVAIYSVSGERLTLQKQRHVTIGKERIIFRTTTRTYEDFCTTPCHLDVVAGTYRFAVADDVSGRKAKTLDVRKRVEIYQNTELWLHHKNRRPARAGFYSAMAASLVAGLAVGIVSAIEQRDESKTLPAARGPLMGTLSFSLVLAGAGFFVGSVLSRDTYTVIPRAYVEPARKEKHEE